MVGCDARFEGIKSLSDFSSRVLFLNVDVRRLWKPLKRAPGLGELDRSFIGELDLDDGPLAGEGGREVGFGELDREPNILSEDCGWFPYEGF